MTLAPGTVAWIDCVVDMAATEADGQHIGSHYIFCKKVLGESSRDALAIAVRFRHRRLTRADCEDIAQHWDECLGCGAPVKSGMPRCDVCAGEAA